MTAPHIVDPAHVLGNLLAEASPDMMRQLLQNMINQLLSADADLVCGAEWGQASPERLVQRNGYRHRPLDTRVGTVDVAVPKLRRPEYGHAAARPGREDQIGLGRDRPGDDIGPDDAGHARDLGRV